MWTGEISLRKAGNLAAWLPRGAAVYSSEGDDRAWTWAEQLESAMVYGIAIGNWQRGGGKGSKPEPLKTPGDQAREHAKHARALDKARQKQAEQRAKKQAQG